MHVNVLIVSLKKCLRVWLDYGILQAMELTQIATTQQQHTVASTFLETILQLKSVGVETQPSVQHKFKSTD